MSKEIEISPVGELLVYKKGYTRAFVLDTIEKKKLRGLRIFSVLQDDVLPDLDFLKDYASLEVLDIVSGQDYDFSFLSGMVSLKELSINVYLGNNTIDLGSLTKLTRLAINWRKGVAGIEKCRSLQEIFLIEFKEADLSKIKMLTQLKRLSIKTGSVKNLSGLENLTSLEYILLGNCRSLQSITTVNGLKDLKEVKIELCPKITDLGLLTDLPSLEALEIIDCRTIQSIGFIRNFLSIKYLNLQGTTDVLDGDLTPAKDIPDVVYRHRRHYNIRIGNPRRDAISKETLEKLKRSYGEAKKK